MRLVTRSTEKPNTGTRTAGSTNETAIIKVIQSLTNMVIHPPEIFKGETVKFCADHSKRLINRIESWLSHPSYDPAAEAGTAVEAGAAAKDGTAAEAGTPPDAGTTAMDIPSYPLFPLSRGFVLSAKQVLKAYKNSLCVAGIDIS